MTLRDTTPHHVTLTLLVTLMTRAVTTPRVLVRLTVTHPRSASVTGIYTAVHSKRSILEWTTPTALGTDVTAHDLPSRMTTTARIATTSAPSTRKSSSGSISVCPAPSRRSLRRLPTGLAGSDFWKTGLAMHHPTLDPRLLVSRQCHAIIALYYTIFRLPAASEGLKDALKDVNERLTGARGKSRLPLAKGKLLPPPPGLLKSGIGYWMGCVPRQLDCPRTPQRSFGPTLGPHWERLMPSP